MKEHDDGLDGLVDKAVAAAADADDVVRLLRAHDEVAQADLRPGLVKTEPPLVELVVEPAGGSPVEAEQRVYDLEPGPTGALSVVGVHHAGHGGGRDPGGGDPGGGDAGADGEGADDEGADGGDDDGGALRPVTTP